MSAPKEPTRQDSLFLLNNNVIIDKYLKSNKYKLEDYKKINSKNWNDQFNGWKEYLDTMIKRDIEFNEKKHPASAYKKIIGDFVGTSDWTGGGGDDYGVPFQYIHPKIAPQYSGDLVAKTSEGYHTDKYPSIFSYGYENLAITPWDMLDKKQQELRLKKYGKTGTPFDIKTESNIPKRKQYSYEQPIPLKTKVNQLGPPISLKSFIDYGGSYMDQPQVAPKTDGTVYTDNELAKMGYRSGTPNQIKSKGTINKYGSGGPIKYGSIDKSISGVNRDATYVAPSSQQIDYSYNQNVPFGTSNPNVNPFYKKQAAEQFVNQGQSATIKNVDNSKQHKYQKVLNNVSTNNDLANGILDFAKFPFQSGINLMNPQIRNDEDIFNTAIDVAGVLPLVGAASKFGIKTINTGVDIAHNTKTAFNTLNKFKNAEKANELLNPQYLSIKEIPDKVRRIGNIWTNPTSNASEELIKYQRLKKANITDDHLQSLTGLTKRDIDNKITDISNSIKTAETINVDNLPGVPTLDDLTRLMQQNRNNTNPRLQNYINQHLDRMENEIIQSRGTIDLTRRPRRNNTEGQSNIGSDYPNIDTSFENSVLNSTTGILDRTRNFEYQDYLNQLNDNIISNLLRNTPTNTNDNFLNNFLNDKFNTKGINKQINNTILRKYISKSEGDVSSAKGSLYRNTHNNIDAELAQVDNYVSSAQSGDKIRGATSLSDSSFPLVVNKLKQHLLNKNLKGVEFEGYNRLNTSGYLNQAGIHPDIIVPYLNSHIKKLSETTGKKIPHAYYDENNGIMFPSLVGVKKEYGGVVKMSKGGVIPKMKFGSIVNDWALNMADPITSIVNKDIIPDSAYKTEVGRDISNVTGGLTNAAAPAAAGLAFGPAGAMGMQAIQMGSNNFVKPNTNPSDTGRVMNSLDPFLRMGASAGAGAIQSNQTSSTPSKKEGGPVDDKTMINVEGGELEIDPSGKILKEFRNKPKHPAFGIDEEGNTMSTPGNIIIPKTTVFGINTKKYKERMYDPMFVNTAKHNLKYNQKINQMKEEKIQMAKYGGKIMKYGGDGPSIVGPRADGGFFGFDNNRTDPMNFMPSLGSNNTIQNLSPQYGPNQSVNSSYGNYNDSGNIMGSGQDNKPFNLGLNSGDAKDIAGAAATYGPVLYNLGRSLFDKPVKFNSSNYTTNPNLKFDPLTGNSGRNDMKGAYASARAGVRNLSGTGAQLQALTGLTNKYFEQLGKFNENLENTNKMGIFEASKANKTIEGQNGQIRFDVDMLKERTRANRADFGSKGVTQISQAYQAERNNKMLYEYLNKYNKTDNTPMGDPIFAGGYNTNATAQNTSSPTYAPSANGLGFNTMWKNYFKRQ